MPPPYVLRDVYLKLVQQMIDSHVPSNLAFQPCAIWQTQASHWILLTDNGLLRSATSWIFWSPHMEESLSFTLPLALFSRSLP